MHQTKEQSEAREAIGSSRFAPAPPLSSTFATRQLLLTCTRPRTRLWVTAETAVKCADHNPRQIDQATRTLENALRGDGMLD